MAGLKGFFQFLSIILCVFLLMWVTNADYYVGLNKSVELAQIYSESIISEQESQHYTTYDGEKYHFTGSIALPDESDNDPLNQRIAQYITIEKIYCESENSQVLSFTGDCSLGSLNNAGSGSRFYKYIKELGETYPFDKVSRLFENDAFTFINLEGTLTTQSKQARKYYRIKGEPEWAQKMILASSIEGCTLANNHSYDYLEEGYTETKQSLSDAGVAYATENSPVVVMVGDIEVVIVVGNYVNDGVKIGLRGNALTKNLSSIIKKHKKPNNIVITVCHWGEELEEKPNESQRTAAHAFIDAGADLVLGHHPHVLQGVEIYGGKNIFYSLGNFAVASNSTVNAAIKKSMIVRPRIALADGVAQVSGVSIVPCYTSSDKGTANNFQPVPLFGSDAKNIENHLLKLSSKISGGAQTLSVPTTVIE